MLDHRKELLVPTPRLRSGLFNRLLNSGERSKAELRTLASRKGIDSSSVPVSLEDPVRIDLVVLGSVAVDRLGHRIGKGEGFADLEFALAASFSGAGGAVTEDTVVVTTVHDCQVFDSLPEQLFQDHDVPVDVIVTPSSIIRVETKLKKPTTIIWDRLSEEKLKQIPLLNQLKLQQPLQPREEPRTVSRRKSKKTNGFGFHFSEIPKEVRISEFKEVLRSSGAKMTFVTWKAYKQSALVFFEGNKDEIFSKIKNIEISGRKLEVTEALVTGEKNVDLNEEGKRSIREKSKKPKEDEYGIFFGKIPRSCKKSEFRKLLAEREIYPDHLNWNGRNGYASAFWNHQQENDFITRLEGIIIQDHNILVEPFKRTQEDLPRSRRETLWKTEVEIKLSPPATEFHLPVEVKKEENTTQKIDLIEKEKVNVDRPPEELVITAHKNESNVISEPDTEERQSDYREKENPILVKTSGNENKSEDDLVENEPFPGICKTKHFETIPSFCDIIRDVKVPISPENHEPSSSSLYKVQESIAQPEVPPSNFAKVVNEVKRNSSKRQTRETKKDVPNSATKVDNTKKTPLSEDKSMYRYLSIDTEEDREKYSKRSSPAKNSDDSNKKEPSQKTGAKQKQKKVVMTRDSSSKRGSSSDNKSQLSGGSAGESKSKIKSGADNKCKSSQNSSHTVSKPKESPSKSEPSKEKECILS